MSEKAEKLNKLAKDVLILSRNTLLVNLRFLDAALSQFEFFPIEESTLLTDGKHILYNPRHILENYKAAKEIPVRDYLHIVMHCVFRHMFMDPTLNRVYWDLACDIAVENVITELNHKSVTAARERGLQIPTDVDVFGFDSVETCSMMKPPLPVVQQPDQLIGTTAAQFLLDRLNGYSAESRVVRLKCRITPDD